MTQLSQQRIVDAATEILQRYGLQDLSIRKVATLLEVQPGALYWHFPHKQALLGAVAEHILNSPITAFSESALENQDLPEWQQQCLQILSDLRAKLLHYRDGAELVSAAFSAETCTIPHIDTLAEILQTHSGAHSPSLDTAHALIVFVLGACVDEQSRTQLTELTETPPEAAATTPQSDIFQLGATLFMRGIEATY
ncbi:MAG: TetR family transcriptional regulator [Lawsonella sp.]